MRAKDRPALKSQVAQAVVSIPQGWCFLQHPWCRNRGCGNVCPPAHTAHSSAVSPAWQLVPGTAAIPVGWTPKPTTERGIFSAERSPEMVFGGPSFSSQAGAAVAGGAASAALGLLCHHQIQHGKECPLSFLGQALLIHSLFALLTWPFLSELFLLDPSTSWHTRIHFLTHLAFPSSVSSLGFPSWPCE